MNFQKLVEVRKPEFYLETAFSRARKQGARQKIRASRQSDLSKAKSLLKIECVEKELLGPLKAITSSFPNIDGLPEFYHELMKVTIEKDQLKSSLGHIGSSQSKIRHLTKIFKKSISNSGSKANSLKLENQYYGRVSSIVKSMAKSLKYLEYSRAILRDYPDIKDNLYTVCIVGFPNTGKSTLLSKITTAKPRIGDYAFTTKTLNVGYLKKRYEDVQVIDSPGTLARLDKMNNVEKQAYLAVKYLANIVVFVYDLTQEYSIQQQDDLLEIISSFDKNVVFYLSKTDIQDSETVKSFMESMKMRKKGQIFTDSEKLREFVIQKSEKY